jgi:hypothetical protein
MDAAKNLLDNVDRAGIGSGSGPAILVGVGGIDSTGGFELVGSVSQRLVLIAKHRKQSDAGPFLHFCQSNSRMICLAVFCASHRFTLN